MNRGEILKDNGDGTLSVSSVDHGAEIVIPTESPDRHTMPPPTSSARIQESPIPPPPKLRPHANPIPTVATSSFTALNDLQLNKPKTPKKKVASSPKDVTQGNETTTTNGHVLNDEIVTTAVSHSPLRRDSVMEDWEVEKGSILDRANAASSDTKADSKPKSLMFKRGHTLT